MPRPDVILGESSRAGMLRGFEKMARLIAITLGPIGGKVVNARMSNDPELLSDAATIMRRIIQLPNRVEDAGAMMLRHMVWRVREEVGDGSATTAVLALAIAQELEHVMAAGVNPMQVKRGVELATDVAVRALEELSVPLEGEDRIAAVAIAATGERQLGQLLGEMYDVLGPDAAIIIQPYIAATHDRAYHEGMRFRGGYVSPYLVTDAVRKVAVLDDVYVLAADMSFDTAESIQHLLEQVLKAGGKNVLLIVKSIADKGIGVMVANNERGSIRSAGSLIKAVGDLRRGTFENIAILTGGRMISDSSMIGAPQINLEDFGRADRVIVGDETFTIIGGHGDKKAIRERLASLRKRARESTDADAKKDYRELATHFSGGIGELRVGGLTEQERSSLTEVAEQTMKVVAVGMEGGVVPGGGAAYLAVIPVVEAIQAEGDTAIGVRVVARALEEPMRRIAANAGIHPPLVIADARRAGAGFGLDVTRKEIVNMAEAGILDPTLVAKRALQLASSGAMMLQTTDALVLHRKPKETFTP